MILSSFYNIGYIANNYMKNIVKYFFTSKSIAYKINNKVIAIDYIYDNEEYTIYITIDNRLKGKMINIDTFSEDKNGKTVRLNIQPGVKPHITPKLLESVSITTVNIITHKFDTFIGDESITYV
jgi:hypothetical protein